ncbi:type VI secretion system protein ImpG [Duganella sp. CF458]|uniref:type VI secretion system baseplate subunit TssF n=1 Tax=Duganella sp. CF458 TaxID=1884368 RepID=UPI0008E3267F|nr:type VI secretion system baseplate subunit TssF [Duganella sp. CF458]SFF63970.1 type VI secretion system protein ImpG [Duganella sp. CF458]
MVNLLHHYQQELARLRQATRRYAEAHPATAAALELEADGSTDPEVERLLQSVALLNASMQKSIEDGRSDFHKALLQTLQPHYLRAVPACGIIQVDTSASRPNEISTVSRLPSGTILRSGSSKFATAYDVCIAPIAIASAMFQATIDLPATLRLPSEATSALCISLEATSSSATFDRPPVAKLRLWVSGEARLRASLLDAIFLHSQCVCIEAESTWRLLPGSPFKSVGTSLEDSLLPHRPGLQSPRLLTEFFHMPQKFDFIDIDLQAIAESCPPKCKKLTLHIVLPGCEPELRQAGAANFHLSCTPVINLFPQAAAAIRLDGRSEPYPVTPAQPGCKIYSIDKVSLMSRNGDRVLPPFHATAHTASGPFWKPDEQEGFALAFVDREQRPAKLETGTISVQLSCTNEEPSKPGSRLTTEASAGGFPIRFIQGPASPRHPSTPRDLCDSLYAQDANLADLRKLLQLHGCPYTQSLKSLAAKPSTAWLEHRMGRLHMHGTEFTLLVDEDALRTHSIYMLGEVLAATLAGKLRVNRFARLRIANEQGRILYFSAPRAGSRPLA